MSPLWTQLISSLRFDVPVPSTDAEEVAAYAREMSGVPQQDASEIKISPNKMRKMREYAFNSNEQYKQIKEKVVGITIDYIPDLRIVYDKLMRKRSLNKSLFNAGIHMIDDFVSVAQKEKHMNIRSFQFFLEKAQGIFDIIGEQSAVVYDTIIKYCFRSSIQYMKGIPQEAWESEFGLRCFGSPFVGADNLYGFKFIDEFIGSNVIEKTEVLSTVDHFMVYMTQMGKLQDDPVSLIHDWYLNDDEQIITWLTAIKKNIDAGRYSTYIFPTIIKIVSTLEEYDICVELGCQVINSMKEYIISVSSEDIEALGWEQFYLTGKAAEIYHKYKLEIAKSIDRVLQNSEGERWERLIEEKEAWSSNLLSCIRNHREMKHSFVYCIDPHKLYDLAMRSNNEQLYTFRQALAESCASGSNFTRYEKDYSHLSELLRFFQCTDRSSISKAKGAQIDWLVDDIQKYIERMRSILSLKKQVEGEASEE